MKWLPLVFIVLFTSVGSVCMAERPNILFIMTDQHFADAMSGVMGDEYVKTPNLDSLAESGVRFDRAYAPNPICVPDRHGFEETGVLKGNGADHGDCTGAHRYAQKTVFYDESARIPFILSFP